MTNITLESKLFELNTLVDYGTYYLAKKTALIDELRPSDIVERMDPVDIIKYLIRDDWGRYMLDEIGSYDIISYVKDNLDVTEAFDSDELLDLVGSYDIKEYCRNNFDADDVYTESDMLDTMSVDDILGNLDEDDIKTWVTENCSVDDWVCTYWR